MLVVALLANIFVGAFAVQEKTIEKTYRYLAPGNLTVDEQKSQALENAKREIIEEAFPVLVHNNVSTMVLNDNGESSVNFASVGGTQVRGKWIKTVGEPRYVFEQGADGQIYWVVTVKGVVREIEDSKHHDFDIHLYHNSIMPTNETDMFHDSDLLLMDMKSPVGGYVCVYLVDPIAKSATLLVPYRNSSENTLKIDPHKQYKFFECNDLRFLQPHEQPIQMNASNAQETNFLYVIYSPHSFDQPNKLNRDPYSLPTLGWQDFESWLGKLQSANSNVQCEQKSITIHK